MTKEETLKLSCAMLKTKWAVGIYVEFTTALLHAHPRIELFPVSSTAIYDTYIEIVEAGHEKLEYAFIFAPYKDVEIEDIDEATQWVKDHPEYTAKIPICLRFKNYEGSYCVPNWWVETMKAHYEAAKEAFGVAPGIEVREDGFVIANIPQNKMTDGYKKKT